MIRNGNSNNRGILDWTDIQGESKLRDIPIKSAEFLSVGVIEIPSNDDLVRWTRSFFEDDQHTLYQLEGIAKRETILREYFDGVKEEMGITAALEIKTLPLFVNGYYNPETDRIVISASFVNHPKFDSAVQTILHESRHAYQFKCVKHRALSKESKEKLDEWQNNIEAYVDAAEDFEDYYKQPIERDAREFSELIINQSRKKK